MTNVLVLDPGERVGWARASVDDAGNWSGVRHGITPLWDMAESVSDAQLEQRAYDVIVCEAWRLYGAHAKSMIGSSFPSVQFIGAVKLVCRLTGTKYVSQPASDKTIGLVRLEQDYPEYHELATRAIAHDDGHDQDALMHLAAYSFKRFGPRRDA
jgi:hypothetical protein